MLIYIAMLQRLRIVCLEKKKKGEEDCKKLVRTNPRIPRHPSETDIPRIQQEAIFPSFWIDSRVSGVQKFVALGIVEYEERRLGR